MATRTRRSQARLVVELTGTDTAVEAALQRVMDAARKDNTVAVNFPEPIRVELLLRRRRTTTPKAKPEPEVKAVA